MFAAVAVLFAAAPELSFVSFFDGAIQPPDQGGTTLYQNLRITGRE